MISSLRKRISLVVSACVLTTAVTLVAYGSLRVPEGRFHGKLAELLPAPPAGWTLQEKAIAETPEMQQAVGELLNFDDGVFANYVGPSGDRISVYLTYWTPGRMSHRLVAGHTPDVCWVGGGWQITSASDTSTILPDIPAGESRIFSVEGTTEHVWFWHVVGAEVKRYGTKSAPPWHAAIKDILQKGLNQREEQFFIRLSSNRDLASQLPGPVLRPLLHNIPWPNPDEDRR